MITIKNYDTEKQNIDWSKLPKGIKALKDDIDFSIEFYNDDDGIKETVDLFLKAVNKVNVPTEKKSTKSKVLKPTKEVAESKTTNEKLYFLKTLWAGDKTYKASSIGEGGKIEQVDKLIYAGRYNEASAMRIAAIIKEDMPDVDFKFVSVKGNEVLISSDKRTKTSPKKSKSTKAIAKTIDAKIIDNFSKEFMLIRRFYNMVAKKEVAPFRSIQLLHMAFQKAAVGRDVRKTSDDADLFTRVNKKVVALFEIAEKEELNVDIDFTDKSLLNEMETYAKGSKINPAITLLKSFIGMQGYKPEVKKAENLLKRMNSAIDKGHIEKENRLHNEVKEAIKELTAYIKKPSEKIEVEMYGLSSPRLMSCVNRIKCTGLKSDGKLRKGYKFNTKGDVIKVIKTVVSKKKVKTKKQSIKQLGTVMIDLHPPIPTAVSNGIPAVVPLVINPISQPVPEPIEKPIAQSKRNMPTNPYVQNVKATKEIADNAKYFDLKGAFIDFTGKLEQKTDGSLVITLDAPPGAGKTRSVFQFLNIAANSGMPSIFASLEEHPTSKIFHDKRELYITPQNEDYIDTIGELPPTYEEFMKLIEPYQIIAIDSWNKVFETYKGIDFDRDLRKALNGKIIVTIFQRTGTGQMRGGSKAGFDGDIILEIVKADDYRDSYVVARKNRYQQIPLNEIGYNFFHQKVINPEVDSAHAAFNIPNEIMV